MREKKRGGWGKRGRKGQLTLFIIVGIVLLSSFGFVFYFNNYMTDKQFLKRIDRVYSDMIQNTPVQAYVSACVNDALESGILLLGEQGGVIYSDQPGSAIPKIAGVSDPQYVNYNGNRVVLVTSNLDTILAGEKYSSLPGYPCNSPAFLGGRCSPSENVLPTNPCYFMWESVVSGHTTGSPGYSGCVPASAKVQGYNYLQTLSYGKKRFFALGDTNEAKLRPTFKEQLESYIANYSYDCVNFTGISILLGQNITKEMPLANVTIAENDVAVNIMFPVTITIEGRPPITRMVDFRASKYARLGLIRDVVDWWTTKDSASLGVDLAHELKTELYDNFDVKIVPGNDFDVYVIKDLLYSNENNKELVFQFARQNRWPSLDYMTKDENLYRNQIVHGKPHFTYPNSSMGYDFFVAAGTPITLMPVAFDPDEDELSFNYSLWREDYVEYWDWDAYAFWSGTNENCTWYPEKCVFVNATSSTLNGHNWTNSNADYYLGNETGKVTIITDASELGPHVVRVNVSDGKYSDWQDIRILVYDTEAITASGENPYDDIPNWVGSIEDPYFLDSRGTTALCQDKIYDWSDAQESTSVYSRVFGSVTGNTLYSGEGTAEGLYLGLLNELACTECHFDINKVNKAAGDLGFAFDTPSAHTLTLTVENQGMCTGSMSQQTLDVDVKECVPHSDPAPAYPYNNMNLNGVFWSAMDSPGFSSADYGNNPDPFQANHACCDGTPDTPFSYDLSSSTTECFHYESVAYKPKTGVEHYPATLARKDDADGNIEDADSIFVTPNLPPGVVWHDQAWHDNPAHYDTTDNDVFRRTVTQSCSGERGNACTGDNVNDDWIIEDSCPDRDEGKGEDETCFGPPLSPNCRDGFKADGVTPCGQWDVSANPGCNAHYWSFDLGALKLYYSFEKDYLKTAWADGVCNNHWRLSDKDGKRYDVDDGTYLCQAGCWIDGCTNPINCVKIDSYDLHIPQIDFPGLSELPAEDMVYGYSIHNPPEALRTGIPGWARVATEVPDPVNNFATFNTWCDGECFSHYANSARDASPTYRPDEPNINYCTSRNYSGYRTPGAAPNREDGIWFTYIDIDDGQNVCQACAGSADLNQGTKWIFRGQGEAAGEYVSDIQKSCCGDDADEYPKSCSSGYVACAGADYCCDSPTDCSDGTGRCLGQDTCTIVGGMQAVCDGTGWADPDTNEAFCNACSGTEWIKEGPVAKCCGDDAPGFDDWVTPLGGFACDNGVRKDCNPGRSCEEIEVSGSKYYCDGKKWYPGNLGGKACYVDADAGQDGICARQSASGEWDCTTVEPIAYNPTGNDYWDTCNSYITNACDATPEPGAFSKDGLCDASNKCCEPGPAANRNILIDVSVSGSPVWHCRSESECDSHSGRSCSPVNGIFSPSGKCDDDASVSGGDGCEPCTSVLGSDGNCEQGCGASTECDERPSGWYSPGPPSVYCQGSCQKCPDGTPIVEMSPGLTYKCGCSLVPNGRKCDPGHDGIFEKQCTFYNCI
ncbi:hypothetical protein J4227_03260 [Candidatus Woesearchaeota archaeon]|nr:hypothetical protein [Candidatus Woesearchaeota archaeon]